MAKTKDATRIVPSLGKGNRIYCPTCEQWKRPEFYHKDRSRPNGLKWQCKECAKIVRAGKTIALKPCLFGYTLHQDKDGKQERLYKVFFHREPETRWIDSEQLKKMGYRIPPARWEYYEGKPMLITYRFKNTSLEKVYISLKDHATRRGGRDGLCTPEDLLQDAFIRLARDYDGEEITPEDVPRFIHSGVKEIERRLKEEQRRTGGRDGIKVYYYEDETELEKAEREYYEMKSGQTPVRTSGEWAFSYKEREIEREEIKREVQRVEAINKGRKRD